VLLLTETLQALVQAGLLPSEAEVQQKKMVEEQQAQMQQQPEQKQERAQEQEGEGKAGSLTEADPAAAAAMVARAPGLLLRRMVDVFATVDAMKAPVLASQEVPKGLSEAERLAVVEPRDKAVKELLRQEPQLLVMEAQEAAERLRQLKALGGLSSSWAQRVQDML
jgi:hypothetical protein